MPGPNTTIYLPYATRVDVHAFTNAAWTQRFTITPSSGAPTVITGSGYFDTLAGSTVINTPQSGSSPQGVAITIAIDHSRDGGITWQASQVDANACQIMYYGLTIVASEDSGDDTWDDATVYFSWTKVPSQDTQHSVDVSMAKSSYSGRA